MPWTLLADCRPLGGAAQHVQHRPVGRLHIHHRLAGQQARVVGLAAGGGVEERAVEHQGRPSIHGRRVEDYGVEYGRIGVCIIETISHKGHFTMQLYLIRHGQSHVNLPDWTRRQHG